MSYFGTFYLDKEKDLIVTLDKDGDDMSYLLQTPNHGTGNLITNLAKICELPLSYDDKGMKVIRGTVPCYIDAQNRKIFIFRLAGTKTANIFEDGTVEMKASIPAISKTLMSQTKDYHIDLAKTIVKTYILSDCKFKTDLHTHMNANLRPDLLIALGIFHEIRYPLYYIKKLNLHITEKQEEYLKQERKKAAAQIDDPSLKGKYRTRRIDDNTFLNFRDLILGNIEEAAYNIPRIRNSLAVMKDGQAVFTNLEKVYMYRYVFTKGERASYHIGLKGYEEIPDSEIVNALSQMVKDRENPEFNAFTLFQDKLLWIARSYAKTGVEYAEISDTTLVKRAHVVQWLREVHEAMPAISRETGVVLRFLAAIRRIPLQMGMSKQLAYDLGENFDVLRTIAADPYVAGADIVGEEVNDIREFREPIRELVQIANTVPGFVIRIHAGENDSLRDNVYNSIHCIIDAVEEGQEVPRIRIGHGLYTANLNSRKGRQLIEDIQKYHAVLEFQITSNVRLNNLSSLDKHPLKQYLHAGIRCVQGTDGGALYGTDSIDEQLSLEKMLELSHEDLLQMRHAEDGIRKDSLHMFEEKSVRFKEKGALLDVLAKMSAELEQITPRTAQDPVYDHRRVSAEVLKEQIRSLPADKIPVVIAGGSFNNDRHTTHMRPSGKDLIDLLLKKLDPDKAFFVIGHSIRGYEKYLTEQNKGRFEIVAIVPTLMKEQEMKRLKEAGVTVCVSIVSYTAGIYKSFYYEIFKRRDSVLAAFDGNTACLNLIQEAKNGKGTCRIYVNPRSRNLRPKVQSLQGYVRLLEGTKDTGEGILSSVDELYEKLRLEK